MQNSLIPEHLKSYVKVDEGIFAALPDIARRAVLDAACVAHDATERMRKEEARIFKKEQLLEEDRIALDHERIFFDVEKQTVEKEKKFMDLQLSVDSFQASLAELGNTRSIHKISKTKEYFELRSDLLNLIKGGKITFEQAQDTLKLFIVENIRRNERDRVRAYRERIKDDVDRQSKEHRAKFRVVKREVVEVRPQAVLWTDLQPICVFQDSVFKIPTKKFMENCIEASKHRMRDDITVKKKAYYLPQVSMRILGTNRFPTNTKLLVVDAGYDWYGELIKEIEKRLEVIENPDRYDESSSDVTWVLLISVLARELRCITSWFDQNVDRVIDYEDFSLFTANDESIPCVRQCVEYLGRHYDDSLPDDLLHQLKGMRVKIYTPVYHIASVKTFKDLKEVHDTHPHLMDLTDDCKSIARIVEYKDHVGVISSIRAPKKGFGERKIKATPTHPPLEVHADIETFAEIETGKVIPYLICWKTEDKMHEEHGKGCIERFVDQIASMNRDIILHCWNGSSYDFHLILGAMKKISTRDKIFVRDNKIISARMWIKDHMIMLRDPYLFIPCSLGKAALDFGVCNKTSFPHDVVKSFSDLDKVLERWYVLREEIRIENDTCNPKVKIFRSKTWHEDMQGPNDKSVLQKAIEYCTLDVLCSESIWKRFKEIMKSELGVDITQKHFTTPQLAFEILRSMTPNVIIRTPSRDQYEFLKRSIYGGRVVAKNGVYQSKKGLVMLDVVSLYPYAMKTYKYPHGMEYITDRINWSRLGIYEVVLTSNTKPDTYAEMVPFREDTGRLSYSWKPKWQGVYNTYDLLSAKESGYEINILHGIEWPDSSYLFSLFVDKLFSIKKNNKGALRTVAKLALNGAGYGKFIQKPIDEDVSIVMKGVMQESISRMEKPSHDTVKIAGTIVKEPEFYELDEEWDKMIMSREGKVSYPTQIGSFILSAARRCLRKKIAALGSPSVLYSDTDSLLIDTNSIDSNTLIQQIGKDIGQLSDSVDSIDSVRIHTAIVLGPKMYQLLYTDPETGLDRSHACMKGIPNKYHNDELFNHLSADTHNEAIASISMLRRNIVDLHLLDATKRIKQTGIGS